MMRTVVVMEVLQHGDQVGPDPVTPDRLIMGRDSRMGKLRVSRLPLSERILDIASRQFIGRRFSSLKARASDADHAGTNKFLLGFEQCFGNQCETRLSSVLRCSAIFDDARRMRIDTLGRLLDTLSAGGVTFSTLGCLFRP
ncbi:hypothetical protein Rwratislav_39128 [Rhodococcus wratislaviensis IFP 2016]|nr:hypothetical protein Rwratislav_39128 [Rhodococcus wratislaviensis IFP 2016]